MLNVIVHHCERSKIQWRAIRAHPILANAGLGICTNSRSFFGGGVSCDDIFDYKCCETSKIARSSIDSASASGGLHSPDPVPGLCPCIPLADFRPPNPLCPPYFQTLATLLLKLREIFLGVKSSIKEIYEN